MHMYIYIYIYMCICICIYIHIYIYAYWLISLIVVLTTRQHVNISEVFVLHSMFSIHVMQ